MTSWNTFAQTGTATVSKSIRRILPRVKNVSCVSEERTDFPVGTNHDVQCLQTTQVICCWRPSHGGPVAGRCAQSCRSESYAAPARSGLAAGPGGKDTLVIPLPGLKSSIPKQHTPLPLSAQRMCRYTSQRGGTDLPLCVPHAQQGDRHRPMANSTDSYCRPH